MDFVVLIILAALVVAYLKLAVRIVRQSERMVIERLGSYQRTLEPGINLIVPFVDQPRTIKIRRYESAGPLGTGQMVSKMIEEERIDLREMVLDFPGQPVVTADNVAVSVNGVIYYQIQEPKRAVYEIENLVQAVETLTKTAMRSEVGQMELDTLFRERATVNAKLAEVLDEAGDKWGVKVTRVEIQDIEIPADVEDAMHKQMAAERSRRAMVTEANGERESEIMRAEGEKKAAILRAEGQRESIEQVLGAAADRVEIKATDVLSYLMGLEYLSTLPDIAKNGERVFLPYEATGVMASIEAIRNIAPEGTTIGQAAGATRARGPWSDGS